MLAWFLAALLAILLAAACLFLRRAIIRLFEFDEIFRIIVDPMQEYATELKKIATAEGLLHDHPEVIAFHKANMKMLVSIEAAIASVRQARPPQNKLEGFPPEAV